MKEVAEITATSWTDLIEKLYADSWSSTLQRFRSPFAFRGVSDADWPLITSLSRLVNSTENRSAEPAEFFERHLLRNFKKYAHNQVLERDSFWFWLTFAQHHGLPTRLLDWTYSPFVALHFATDNLDAYDRDGAIWMVNLENVRNQLPPVLKKPLDKEGSIVFTTDMLAKYEKPVMRLEPLSDGWLLPTGEFTDTPISSLADFDKLAEEKDFLLFFEPPSLDDRVINQFALFSIIPNPRREASDWLSQYPEYARKVVIPKDLKAEVRDKLDQANINERVLFPGLDGLSRWLRRHYSTFTQHS